jgi:hypothetical protein
VVHFFRRTSFSKCKTKYIHELILFFLSFLAIVCLRFIYPFFYTVEFQKRGLPHCHTAILYSGSLQTHQNDSFVINNQIFVIKGGIKLDNGWIVPHNRAAKEI